MRTRSHPAELLADAPVDALTEQVGVPVVAGVLLDHVHEQLAQRDRLTLGVVADETEGVVPGELPGGGDLLSPGRPRPPHHGRARARPAGVALGHGLGLATPRYGQPA